MRYYLGLGSNLGRPERNIARARGFLQKRGFKILAASSLYRTEPVDFVSQPWFLNQAIEVETDLTPAQVLNAVKAVEKRMKRRPSAPKGPRLIDIDILLAEDTILQTEALTIPHPRLGERNFALVPLAEIAPEAVHPLLKKTISRLKSSSTDRAEVRPVKGR